MNPQQAIEKAIAEIGIAEALIEQARQKYSVARKQLEAIFPAQVATTKKTRSVLSEKSIAKLLEKKPVRH